MSEIEKYKGFSMTFNPHNEKFYAEDPDGKEVTSSGSFSGLKANVDAYIKRQKKLKPFEAIWRGRDQVVRVSTIADEHFERIWVSWKQEGYSRRSRSDEGLVNRYSYGKEKPANFFKKTDENLKILERIHFTEKSIEKLEAHIKQLREKYTNPITTEYLKELTNKEG